MTNAEFEKVENTETDRLRSVEVFGLFRNFDHRIDMSADSTVTVIHGPNGVGKTIVLRMIREVLSGEPDLIHRVPFESFRLRFDSGDEVVLTKSIDDEQEESIVSYFVSVASEIHKGTYEPYPSGKTAQMISSRLPGGSWRYQGEGVWLDQSDGEQIDYSTALTRISRRGRLPKNIARINEDFDLIHAKCNVRLIGTDRLTDRKLVPEEEYDVRHGFPARRANTPGRDNRTIGRYSRDLIRQIKTVLSEYGKLTELLDRSLVQRLLAKDFDATSPEEVLKEFKRLDNKRRELTKLGLLTESEDVLTSDGDADVLALVTGRQDVFSIYVSDMQKKLAIFDALGEKLRILLERTKMRFQFKSLEIDPEKGLLFKSDSGSKLDVSDLSSGEQHEMIFFYDLLFFAGNEDLILIDEPEISLHMAWQMEFMNDLKTALSSSNAHVLLATHSPAIAEAAGTSLIRLGD